jgi:hypothetical protein
MRTRRTLRGALVALTLCFAGHPAFADGAIPSPEELRIFVFKLLGLTAIAILVVVLVIRGLARTVRAAVRKGQESAAAPQIPTARIIESTRAERDADR